MEDFTNIVKMAEYKLRNILSVIRKNKLLLNEYLGDFMHFETLFFFFSVEMGLTPPP